MKEEHSVKTVQSWAEKFTYPVGDTVWDRVTQQVATEELADTVKYYKWMSVAAVMVSIIAVLVAIKPPTRSSQLAGSPVLSTPASIEQLADSNLKMYSLETARNLTAVYQSLEQSIQ